MDDDGNPGYTLTFSGFFNGKLYSVQRRILELEGITLGPDRVLGLIRTSYETVGLGGEFPDAEREDAGPEPEPEEEEDEERGPPFETHPDPKESWFEEVRLSEGATCDDVMRLEDDGRISRIRPF